MTEVVPMLKTKADCEGNQAKCSAVGCPLFGTLGREARDGNRRVRGCGDPTARGKRNRAKGLAKQRTARKALGVASRKFSDANEETWVDPLFENEVKSGKQVGPVWNWWRKVKAQVVANRADHGARARYVRAVAMPEGTSEGLVVVELTTWNELVRPALDEFYGES